MAAQKASKLSVGCGRQDRLLEAANAYSNQRLTASEFPPFNHRQAMEDDLQAKSCLGYAEHHRKHLKRSANPL